MKARRAIINVRAAWIGATGAIVLCLIVLVTRTAGPRQRSAPPLPSEAVIDAQTIVASVSPEGLRRDVEALTRWPSRMPGTVGFTAAADRIRSSFQDLGLRVIEHPFDVTVPVTRYCELLDEQGKPISGVQILPFYPNLVRTCTTPAEGISGRAVIGQRGGGAYVHDFPNVDPPRSIPLVALSAGEQWIGLADAGFPAIIFFRGDDTQLSDYRGKELSFPADFPRFLLTGDPGAIAGKSVRIRCRVDWQTLRVSHILAVLEPRSQESARDAIVLTSHYDTISPVPDLAPGAEEASSVAVMLAAARLAAQNRDQLTRTMVFAAMAGHGQACTGARLLAELWGPPGDERESQRAAQRALDSAAHERKLDARQALEVQKLLHGFEQHLVITLAVSSRSPVSGLFAQYPDCRQSVEGSTGWIGNMASDMIAEGRSLLRSLLNVHPTDKVALARAQELLGDGITAGVDLTPQIELRGGSMYYPFSFFYEFVPFLAEGRDALAWGTPDDRGLYVGTPEDLPEHVNYDNLTLTARLVCGVGVRMGCGRVPLRALPHLPRTKAARGQVVEESDPSNVIPTRGVAGALVVARHREPIIIGGVRQEDLVRTDEAGNFRFPLRDPTKPPEDFQAFRLDAESGRVIAVKDQGERGEGSFPTRRTWNNFDNPLRLVLFPAAQTDLFYPLHPSTGVELGSAFAVEHQSLTPPRSFAVLAGRVFPPSPYHLWNFDIPGQGFALFNPPATRFYLGLKGASPLDPSLESVVAYLLGPTVPAIPPSAGQEVWGDGYLARDTPRIRAWMYQAASAMAAVDGHRLRRQAQHRVADPLLIEQHKLAAEAVNDASESLARGEYDRALRAAQDSLAISMEVYPRIGQTERDAVVGVLFYLFLLIPFSAFVERLVLGASDLRLQLVGVGSIFVGVFLLLRSIHPAFELVSSGIMVLIGFLTLSLSLFVTIFLFTKFRQNVRELQSRLRKTAAPADISRASAAAVAFALGINNMRRRKLRTAFTCGTLVLVTFALLSLSAVTRESRFKRIAAGRAPYTGLLIQNADNTPLAGTSSLVERFGQRFAVGRQVWRYNSLRNTGRGGVGIRRDRSAGARTADSRGAVITNIVGLDPVEAEITDVRSALVAGRWFRSDSEPACLLPLPVARHIGITPDMAERGTTRVFIDGVEYSVVGLFDPLKLEQVTDLDGQGLLPFDGSAITSEDRAVAGGDASSAESARSVSLPGRVPRLPGTEVALMPSRVCGGFTRRLAVDMGDISPADALAEVSDFVKRWEGFIHYGVGGVSYYGRVYRGTQLHGLADILVPLLIAGAIVLNTMLGSVYERTSEIGVYSAVGLSPTHVRYLFLAEACVYAVIGAVAGYLLAHGLGLALSAAGVTAGLSFNYSSLATVYSTAVMMGVVLLSTWYPARKASRLAMPADSMSIRIPDPQNDMIEVPLPFSYAQDEMHDGAAPSRYPGERRWALRRERIRDGIPLTAAELDDVSALAREFGVESF